MAVLLALLAVAAPAATGVALADGADDGDARPVAVNASAAMDSVADGNATDDETAPPDRWSTTVGGGDDDKLATGVRVDGGYLVVGWSNSSTDGDAHDGYVAKLDRTGETEWERTYGGSGTDRLYDVEQVEDGFLLAGMATDGVTGSWNGWLLKIGPDGVQQWDRTYGDDPGAFWSLDGDGEQVYVGGWMEDRSTTEAWAMELDADGDPVWSETYETSYAGADEYANSVFATGGDLLVTGSVVGTTADPSDAWAFEVGDGGDRQWGEIYGGGKYDRVHDAAAADDGGYVLAGRTASQGSGGEDGWLVKIDGEGDRQWDRTYGQSMDDAFFGVHADPDGGYVVSGAKHMRGEDGGDGWVVRTDDEGHGQWQTTRGESYWDKFWPVIEGHGGGYLAVGESTSFGDDRDGWVVRLGGPAVAAIEDADANESGTRVAFEDSRVRSVTLSESTNASNASGVLAVSEPANLSALSPPGDPVYAVTVTDPDGAVEDGATVEPTVETDEVDGEVSDLRVAERTDGNWSVLATEVVAEENGTVALSANASADATLAVTVVPAPTAAIDASEAVTVGEPVELSAAGSTAGNGTLAAYEWAVGERTASGPTASVSFDSPGEREVELTVTDENGLEDDATATVVVNDRPEVDLDAPDELTVGSAGDFSVDVADEVGETTVTWQFGDGAVTGESVEHGFGSAGARNVTVVVEDEYGATATEEVTVAVREPETDETTDAVETTTGVDAETAMPGFGVAIALGALLVSALLVRARR